MAHAFVGAAWNYVSQYQVGVDYTSSYDHVDATYETSATPGIGKGCEAVDDGDQRCSVRMSGGRSSGYGLFLQQAFRRQGFFYFKPDLGFGLRYLSGALDRDARAEQAESGLPLRSLDFSLLALVVKPYVTVGITPASRWPDFLVSIGPALQLATGTVKVNDDSASVAMATSSRLLTGFFEMELVVWRFGEGALSLFTSQDFTGSGQGTKFYPKTVDGMDDFRGSFRRQIGGGDAGFYGLGAKLVTTWP